MTERSVRITRRRFLEAAGLGAGSLAIGCRPEAEDSAHGDELPAASRDLKPMTAGVVPISEDERKGRIAKAQDLMARQKLDAVFMEGTTSCFYYTGMRWGQSERTFGVVIPANGPIAYVCPGFEEDRVREQLKPAFGSEVRVWQEDESPYAVIAGVM